MQFIENYPQGYWEVADQKFINKYQALLYATKTNNTVQYRFFDDVWQNFDRSLIGKFSLNELYKQRAQQLRDSYDYLILYFSGGADSYTMLRAFVDQGLFVDELATFHNFGGDGSWDTYLNSEVKRVAIPMAEKVLEASPNTKFRLVDHTDYQPNLFNIDDNKFDFFYKANAVFSPNQLARRYIREKNQDYLDLFAQGKRVCFIWGMDKPRVNLQKDGRYAMQFVDIVDNSVNPVTQQLNRPWENDEFFYWSPDSKDMLCKQGHIIMRYLKNIPEQDLNSRWLARKGNVLGNGLVNGKMWYLTNDGCHRLIYEDWHPDTYTSGKHDYLLMWSPRDEWFLKDTHAEHTQIYKAGLEKLAELVGNDWIKIGGITKGLMTCLSNPLYLE